MPQPRGIPEAREVDRVEVLVAVNDSAHVSDFLIRCVPGSTWTARIRTAVVTATVLARNPLGTLSERDCVCVRLALALPVPVEPGLRLGLSADDDSSLTATAVVRPWGD